MSPLKFQFIRIGFLGCLLAAAAFVFNGCGGGEATPKASGSPTESYQRLYNAVKAKDTEAIRGVLSQGSLRVAEMQSQQLNKPMEAVLENGLTATTFSPTLPEIRDERVKGNYGAVEVWNSKDGVWEDLPFIIEDGSWKLALGDAFSGKFKDPGMGRDRREKEAANALNPPKPQNLNVNMNMAPNSKLPNARPSPGSNK